MMITPRLPPLSPRKSAIICVVDVGTSKVVCLIARLVPVPSGDILPGRTHVCRIVGIGHQPSRGMKAGAVIDMEAAEQAIRRAVDAAERMARVQVDSVIVNISGGRLGSTRLEASLCLSDSAGASRTVSGRDMHRVVEAATMCLPDDGRAILHAMPTGFCLDGTHGIDDPRTMIGKALDAYVHVVSCEAPVASNLILAVERGHLDVGALVTSPYAAGLSALVDDEADMGTVLVDMGGGTTSIGVFSAGRLVHVDCLAMGGQHVTMDLARGLNLRIQEAEQFKIAHGACRLSGSDGRDMVSADVVKGRDTLAAGNPKTGIPKSRLVSIIAPRVEEILELVQERITNAGYASQMARQVVLTGGASQLSGLTDTARKILSPNVRQGRPLGVQGLPESARSPAFATAVGLLVFPQVVGSEHFAPGRRPTVRQDSREHGYIRKVGQWLRESF